MNYIQIIDFLIKIVRDIALEKIFRRVFLSFSRYPCHGDGNRDRDWKHISKTIKFLEIVETSYRK